MKVAANVLLRKGRQALPPVTVTTSTPFSRDYFPYKQNSILTQIQLKTSAETATRWQALTRNHDIDHY